MVKNQRPKKIYRITIIKLLIAIVITGILSVFILPKFLDNFGCRLRANSEHTALEAQIELFSTALNMYKLDTGKYPSHESGLSALITKPDGVENWQGPYLMKSSIPKDPWGREFIYELPGEHVYCDLISYGADGIKGGTGDNRDFVYSEMYQ